MAIIQISKIQARSGNLVDLPQLDEAEFGWASDTKRLFIGKTTPNENIEILTSFSSISFSQLNGSVGNLSINPVNVDNGQVLAYNGVNWVNRGGKAGGLITLGDVGNVKINGGAIGFVLETDGTGNLAWTPKSAVIAFIENVSQSSPAVVTTTTDNFFPDDVQVTITDVPGMTELNGNTYIAKILTSRTFELYDGSDPLDSSGFTPYAFTDVTDTALDGTITVTSNDQFSENDPVRFVGDVSNTGLENDVTYFVKTKVSSTGIRVSETLEPDGTAGDTLSLTVRTGMTASVYVEGGRAISAAGTGAGGSGIAGGAQGTIQFNDNGLSNGKATLTFNKFNDQLTVDGDANVQNLNANGNISAIRFFSNIANGTSPLQVQSRTPVANLHSEKATVAVKSEVNSASTGNYFPVFGNSLTGNIALLSNSNLVFNASTGELTVTKLKSTTNTNIEGNANILGDTDISGNLNLTLDANFEANLIVENATVNSVFITDTLIVQEDANIIGNLVVNESLIAKSEAIFEANANISSNLSVDGFATIASNLIVGNINANAEVNADEVNANVGSFGNIDGNGRAIFSINASNIDEGTLSQARLANDSITINGIEIALGNSVTIAAATSESLIAGDYLIGANFNGSTERTWTVDASSNNVSNTVVARDEDGSFAANNITATTVEGILTTAAQTNITSVGELISLDVTGNIDAGNVSATDVSATTLGGTLTTATQTNITSVGELISLDVTGNISAGNVSAADVSATTLGGTLTTAAQPNVTSVGTLTSLGVTGNIDAGNVSATDVTATALGGTLTTAAQPNVTSVGTLTSLGVTGNISAGNVNGGNLVQANFIQGDGSLLTNLPFPIVDPSAITNGNSEVKVEQNGDARFKISGVDDVLVVSSTSATLTGNLVANSFAGDGSSLTDLDADNITSGTLGSGRLSGDYDISVSSANILSESRNINGTAFNGSANITTATWGTARNITIGSTSRSVNGSQNVSWTLADIGAAPAGNYLTSVNLGRTEGTTSVTITNSAGTDTTIRDATTSRAGLVTTGNQTWGGTKTAVNFVASSDERLKDNIESLDINGCLDTVLSLRPASYTWKINGEYDTGLIAQEVEKVIPHKVHKSEDGTLALSYSKLVTELIGAVQAQNKLINELREQVEELKGKK